MCYTVGLAVRIFPATTRTFTRTRYCRSRVGARHGMAGERHGNSMGAAWALYAMCESALRRFQWPRGLRCGSAAACLLRLSVRIPPGTWISVSCECCILSGKGLCNKLITLPESYRIWYLVLCGHKPREWGGPGQLGAFAPKTKQKDRLNTPKSNAAKQCGCLHQLSFGVMQIHTDFSRHCRLPNNSANCLPQPVRSNENNRSVNKYTTLYEPER